MELLQWFIMGILFTLSVQAIAYLSVIATLKWYTYASLITGCSAILFGIGWAGASFLEGISQSGSMALILFCGFGLVLITLTWRFLIAPELNTDTE
jgi:hypothetical protein